jgi:parallel beta-helix repeat protein
LSDDGLISGCVASENGRDGIVAGEGASIRHCSANYNEGDGIEVDRESVVEDCFCENNGYGGGDGAGIHVTGDDCRIQNNTVTDNDRGLDLDGSGSSVAGNIARDNTSNYEFAAGNHLDLLLSEVPQAITWPASLRFAGTLICTDTTTNGITVAADNVTIDLGGHALISPGSTSREGIFQDSGCHNLRVHNGIISGWNDSPRAGVRLRGDNNLIANLALYTNYYGIYCDKNVAIRDCVACGNYSGMRVMSAATIQGCVSRDNSNYGIQGEGGSTIADCMVAGNQYGIIAKKSSVRGCSAVSNYYGMYCIDCSIKDCSAVDNYTGIDASYSDISGCSANDNTRHGIFSGKCYVYRNICRNNGTDFDGAGIRAFGSGSRIEDNYVADNCAGIYAFNDRNFIVRNTAYGNNSNYCFYTDNATGMQVNVFGSGGITTDNPWVNFVH